MRSYTTVSGDTWDLVSYRVYGSEFYMHLLIGANPSHRFTARFDSGTVLTIPALPAASVTENVPPWRR